MEYPEDLIDEIDDRDAEFCPICGNENCQLDDDEHELDDE